MIQQGSRLFHGFQLTSLLSSLATVPDHQTLIYLTQGDQVITRLPVPFLELATAVRDSMSTKFPQRHRSSTRTGLSEDPFLRLTSCNPTFRTRCDTQAWIDDPHFTPRISLPGVKLCLEGCKSGLSLPVSDCHRDGTRLRSAYAL